MKQPPHPAEIVRLLESTRFVLSGEKAVQEKLSATLEAAGIRHRRELEIAPGDIVDFMIEGGTVIEMKIKAPKRAIYRQCARYCAHPQVTALVLATATAIGFPPEIEGKPCYVASLGRGWL